MRNQKLKDLREQLKSSSRYCCYVIYLSVAMSFYPNPKCYGRLKSIWVVFWSSIFSFPATTILLMLPTVIQIFQVGRTQNTMYRSAPC
uniref:Uncharacterized protein n=1 Tax=Arundo donax TaxID=35708 RepID=A0A0A9D341_ARUDO